MHHLFAPRFDSKLNRNLVMNVPFRLFIGVKSPASCKSKPNCPVPEIRRGF